ncbi:MAG: site-specific integrase [Anaerohalosphaeraceae bacterium]
MDRRKISIGSVFLNNGRYYWRGILPGETERKAIPLKPIGSNHATKDLGVAKALAQELLSQHIYNTTEVKQTQAKTFADLIRAYYSYIKKYYNSKEPANIKYAIEFLRSKYQTMPIEDFGPLKLKALRSLMIKEKNWSRGVINQRIRMIIRMFKWAASEQLVPIHIYQSLATIESLHRGRSEAKETKKIKPVSDDHIEAVLPYLSQTVADMVRLQRLTGMRSTELCIIRPVDIDRTNEVWIYSPSIYKGEHLDDYERKVALGPHAQAVLCKYLIGDPQAFCFTPSKAQLDRGRQPVNYRPRYDKDTYGRAIRRALNAANREIKQQCKEESPDKWEKLYESRQIPLWHPHQIRHTHATVIASLDSVETAKAALGHKRLQTTEIYAEKDMRRAIDAARKYG